MKTREDLAQDLVRFTKEWYFGPINISRRTFSTNSRFVRFASRSLALAKQVYAGSIKVRVSGEAVTASLNRSGRVPTIVLPAWAFTLQSDKMDDPDFPISRLTLVNGLIIHEALHAVLSPATIIKFEKLGKTGLTVDEQIDYSGIPLRARHTIINIIEDHFIEMVHSLTGRNTDNFLQYSRATFCASRGEDEYGDAEHNIIHRMNAVFALFDPIEGERAREVLSPEVMALYDKIMSFASDHIKGDKIVSNERLLLARTSLTLRLILVLFNNDDDEEREQEGSGDAGDSGSESGTESASSGAGADDAGDSDNDGDDDEERGQGGSGDAGDSESESGAEAGADDGNDEFPEDYSGVDTRDSLISKFSGVASDSEKAAAASIANEIFESGDVREASDVYEQQHDALRGSKHVPIEMDIMNSVSYSKSRAVGEYKDIGQRIMRSLLRIRSDSPTAGSPRKRGSRISSPNIHRIATDGLIFSSNDNYRPVETRFPEVVILADGSGSIYEELWVEELNFLRQVFLALQSIGVTITIGVHSSTTVRGKDTSTVYKIAHSSGGKRVYDLDERMEKAACIRRVQNYDGYALKVVRGWFEEENSKKLVMILSDGQPCGISYHDDVAMNHTREVIDELKEDGIALMSVSLVKSVVHTNDALYGDGNVDASDGLEVVKKQIQKIIADQMR